MTAVAVASERARLHLDAVGTTIVTHVARRHSEGMTIRHALPFLRLHSRVRDEAEMHSRIKRVAIDMDGDIPQLVVELRRERGDATIPFTCPVVEDALDVDYFDVDVDIDLDADEPVATFATARDDEPTEVVTHPPEHMEEPALVIADPPGATLVLRRSTGFGTLVVWLTRRIEMVLSWLATL